MFVDLSNNVKGALLFAIVASFLLGVLVEELLRHWRLRHRLLLIAVCIAVAGLIGYLLIYRPMS